MAVANKTPFKTPLKGINTRVNSEAKFKAMLEELDVEINAQCREMTHAAQVGRESLLATRAVREPHGCPFSQGIRVET